MTFLPTPTKLKVKTVSLDTYCTEKNIYPDFIKIDAEGAEHLILKAMTELMKNHKPLISIEVAGDEEWKDNCKESIDFLQQNGYVAYEIDLNGYVKLHIQQESYSYDNLLFAHPDNMERLKAFIR